MPLHRAPVRPHNGGRRKGDCLILVSVFSRKWCSMLETKNQTSVDEKALLRKLRIWIVALAIACLLTGMGVGAMLSGKPTVAQKDLAIAHAPEALSASFSEIARRVEPAVVNIETMTAVSETVEKNEDKEDESSPNPLLDMFRRQDRRPTRGVGSGFIVSPKGYI